MNNEVKEKIIENAKYVFKHIDIIIMNSIFNAKTGNIRSKIKVLNLIFPNYNIYHSIYKLYENAIFIKYGTHLSSLQEHKLESPANISQIEYENRIKHIHESYTNKFEFNFELFITDSNNNLALTCNNEHIKTLYDTFREMNIKDIINNNKITEIDENIKDNYENLNNKITELDENIKDNYENLNNKIIELNNQLIYSNKLVKTLISNYENLNNKITEIDKTVKNNYEILNNNIIMIYIVLYIYIIFLIYNYLLNKL
jgi:hypothetical protein